MSPDQYKNTNTPESQFPQIDAEMRSLIEAALKNAKTDKDREKIRNTFGYSEAEFKKMISDLETPITVLPVKPETKSEKTPERKNREIMSEKVEIKTKEEPVKKQGEVEPVINTIKIDNTKKEIEQIIAEGEITQDIKTKTDDEKREIGWGLKTLGFKIERKKNELFKKAIDNTVRVLHIHGSAKKYCEKLSESFNRDAIKAEDKALEKSAFTDSKILGANISAEAKKITSNTGLLVGNVLKYGRIVADVTGASIANPFRYVMMGGMVTTRLAEAGKDARLGSEVLIEKTRVEDIEKAEEEAYAIYERARQKAEATDGKIDRKKLQNAYIQEIPKELQKKLEDTSTSNGFVQKILRKDISIGLSRLQKKIEKIEDNIDLTPAQKESQIEALIGRQQNKLEEYDRMVTEYGTVDEIAASLRYTQKLGKAVVLGMQIETAVVSVERLWGKLANVLASHGADATDIAQAKVINNDLKIQLFGPKTPPENFHETLEKKGWVDLKDVKPTQAITEPTEPTIKPIIKASVAPEENYVARSTPHIHHIKEATVSTEKGAVLDNKEATKNITIDDKNIQEHINKVIIPTDDVDGQNINGVDIPKDSVGVDTKGLLDGDVNKVNIPTDTEPVNLATGASNTSEIPSVAPHINETTAGFGDKPISPTLREYNTGGVRDINPTGNIYKAQGVQLEHNPYENIVNPHHVNEVINEKSEVLQHLEQGSIKSPAQLSEHFSSADQLKQFDKNTIAWERQDNDTIGNMSYKEWNIKSDKLFFETNHMEFNSYNEYAKEHALQQLFGTGDKKIVAVDENGVLRNARHYTMNYFRATPEWGAVEKVPAREFFNNWNADVKLIDGSKIPQADLQKLIDSKILRNVVNENGDHIAYEFKGKNELERLAKLYREVTPKEDRMLGNDRPIGNESIESYITRITKRVHQALDGTDYGFKNIKVDSAPKIRAPRGGLLRGLFENNDDNGPIAPRRGWFNTGRTWS